MPGTAADTVRRERTVASATSRTPAWRSLPCLRAPFGRGAAFQQDTRSDRWWNTLSRVSLALRSVRCWDYIHEHFRLDDRHQTRLPGIGGTEPGLQRWPDTVPAGMSEPMVITACHFEKRAPRPRYSSKRERRPSSPRSAFPEAPGSATAPLSTLIPGMILMASTVGRPAVESPLPDRCQRGSRR
jgi:hypothetical protein